MTKVDRLSRTASLPEATQTPSHGQKARASSRNVLIISHPCITPINQSLFAHVEAETGWNITIVLPMRWRNEYGRRLSPARWPQFHGRLWPVPVALAGSIPLHFYWTRLDQIFERERPSAIYVHNEPYALATYQAFRFSNRLTTTP